MRSRKRFDRPGRGRVTLAAGLIMMGALVLLALLAPAICRYDPEEPDLYAFLKPPGGPHPFGTDQLGRDVFSRVLYAARLDLLIMALAEAAPFAIGVLLGMTAAYFGGWVDWLISLTTDAFIAFPFYLLAVVVAFATGGGVRGIFITFTLVGWLTYARVARGVTGALMKSEWLDAAKVMGYPDARIIATQIFPNVLPQAIVVLMSDMAGLLAVIVTLGYLGIGVAAPTPDWGAMISEGQPLMETAWWLSVIPGLTVVYAGVALSFIGDGLADLWR